MDRATQIIEVIEKNPGIKFREIMRETGMKNGVLGHYATKLERDGIVKVERSPGQTRFYPPGVPDDDMLLIKNLRQETPKQILSSLLQYEMLSFSELVVKTQKSPATVSLYLSQIAKDGIVENKLVNAKKKYYVKDMETLREIIDKYHPSLIEASADRLADTFSSL
ncbi:MAG: winged helix-turn-helix transcriptional regulator [Nitrosotalea sp.]